MQRRSVAPYSRRRYRQALRDWVLRNSLPVGGVTALFLVIELVFARVMDGYLLGLFQGLLIGVLVLALTTAFLVHTNMTGQLAGAWGEEFTRDELAKARRRRAIWGWVDSLERNGADVDHLVVLRSGRVVAIDSKWRRSADDETRLEADAQAAKRSARRAAAVLQQVESTKSVSAVVAVWGQAQDELHGQRIGGVAFVSGRQLRRWLSDQKGVPCDRGTATRLLGELRAYQRAAGRRSWVSTSSTDRSSTTGGGSTHGGGSTSGDVSAGR